MSRLFRKYKNDKYKIFEICGLKIKVLRGGYKKQVEAYKKIPKELKEGGFSLLASFGGSDGEGQVARDLLKALQASDISLDVKDLKHLEAAPVYKNKITMTTEDYVKKPSYNNITGLWWEFESGMLQARPYSFENTYAVLAFSTFCFDYFNKVKPDGVKVVKVTYPFDFSSLPVKTDYDVRGRYGIAPDDFVCFFNFSFNSSYFRKNPEAVLEAFAKSLKGKQNAKLFIKSQHSDKSVCRNRFYDKVKEYGLESHIVVEEGNITREAMMDIINASDVYMSLHRGEGLGLGMLEAMAMGKPVIATNYGGNTDFVKEGVAFPVAYELVKPKELDNELYRYVETWAEPDVDEAAGYLLRLYEDGALRVDMGKKAESFVKAEFTSDRVVEELRALL